MDDSLKGRILARINDVPDPCSMSQAVRIGLADMGLVTDVRISEAVDSDGHRNVKLVLRVTAPGCMYVPFMDRSIRTALEGLDEIAGISTEWEPTADWTPDDIAAPVRQRMTEARERRRKEFEARSTQAVGLG